MNLLNVTASKEDALFTYLNTPDPSLKKTAESFQLPSTTSSLVEPPTNDTDSELSTYSDQISPTPTYISLEMIPSTLNADKDAEIDAENGNLYLPNETQILSCEYLNKSTTDAIQNGLFLFVYICIYFINL